MADNIKASEVSKILVEKLRDLDLDVNVEEVGQVLPISDGVARVYGLKDAEAG